MYTTCMAEQCWNVAPAGPSAVQSSVCHSGYAYLQGVLHTAVLTWAYRMSLFLLACMLAAYGVRVRVH